VLVICPNRGLGGKLSARECIDEMKRTLKTMEGSDSLPNPNDVLYSVLLTALSYSKDSGTADEANVILQHFYHDPNMQMFARLGNNAEETQRLLEAAPLVAQRLTWDRSASDNIQTTPRHEENPGFGTWKHLPTPGT
jgi:hypothetical protein